MRLPACITGLILFTAFGAENSARIARDWQAHPAIVQVDGAAAIFAIGDVHGDRERLLRLLNGAGIIRPEGGRPVWSAGEAVLVFTGDMIDKGPDALGVIALIRSLKQQGRVIALLGNHEAEFLAKPGGAKSREFAAELTHAGLSPAAVARCEGEIGEFLCSLPLAARVNDWFFSHAGNTEGRTIPQLDAALQRAIELHGFGDAELIGDNSLLEARFGDRGPGGQSWIDAGGPRLPAAQLLDRYATALGIAHIVEGHHHGEVRFPDGAVRRSGEMFQWRSRLFLIDTGMSREIDDSTGAALHITPDSASAVCANGRTTVIWDRRAQLAGRAKPCR